MRKLRLFILMPILLASCNTKGGNKYADYEKWVYLSPTGAPAIAMSYFSGFENFQTNSDPSNIVAMMKAGKGDLVVLPTNVGIQAIRQGNLPYKLYATLTHGNVYVASTGNDADGVMDENDYIVSFQKGAVPDKIFHYIYGNSLDNAMHYVSNAQEAAKCLKTGKNLADDKKSVDYVVLAEPALTSVLETTENIQEYADLQELYKVKSGGLGIYQAALFIKDGLDQPTLMESVLGNLGFSLEKMNRDPNKVVEYMNLNSNPELTFGVKPEIAKKMFENGNRMNIDCKYFTWKEGEPNENVQGINIFLSLFGLEGISEDETI